MLYIYMLYVLYRYHLTPATWKMQNFWKRTCILPGVDKCGQCGQVSKWLVASSSTLTTSDLDIGMTCFVCEAMACTTSKPAEKSRSGPAVLATASRPGNPAWQAPRLRVFKAPSRLLQKPAESNIRQRRCGLHQPLRPAISAIVIIVISLSLTSLTS